MDSLIKDVSGATDLPGFDKIINRLLSETIDFFTTTESKLNLLRNLGIRPSSGNIVNESSTMPEFNVLILQES